MKFIMNDQSHSTTFGAIAMGEIFIWDYSVLIKTDQVENFEPPCNAVDLANGAHYSLNEFDEVICPISYELSVNY